jgi:thiamine-monophosphate kinase
VSGECGWAAAGLELLLPAQQRPHSLAALLATFSDENTRRAVRAQVTPQPHLALGCRLRGVATAALDVSDGLVQDLAHLLFESGVGATLAAQDLPVASMLQGRPDALQKTLAGGEDFVLLFTAPPDGRAESLDKSVRRMGTVTSEKSLVVGGITLAAEDVEALHRGQMPQNPLARAWVGWRHF